MSELRLLKLSILNCSFYFVFYWLPMVLDARFTCWLSRLIVMLFESLQLLLLFFTYIKSSKIVVCQWLIIVVWSIKVCGVIWILFSPLYYYMGWPLSCCLYLLIVTVSFDYFWKHSYFSLTSHFLIGLTARVGYWFQDCYSPTGIDRFPICVPWSTAHQEITTTN